MICPSGEKSEERRERDFVTTGDDVLLSLFLLSALVQVALSESKLTDRRKKNEEGLIGRKEGEQCVVTTHPSTASS